MSDTAPPSPDTSKPVLVMGANGFMGSHVTKQLLSAGRRVRVMVRKSSDTRALEGLNVETYYGDITDRSSVLDAMHGCTSVFYNVVDTRAWLVDSSPLYATNVEALQTVLGAAIDSQLERFVFTSSGHFSALCGHPRDRGERVRLVARSATLRKESRAG